jgi:hypothetical protein
MGSSLFFGGVRGVMSLLCVMCPVLSVSLEFAPDLNTGVYISVNGSKLVRDSSVV